MGIEVELKAWVDDHRSLLEQLQRLGAPRRSYTKEDWYFGPSADLESARYRLRRDGDAWIATFKDKRIYDGIEENTETEFTVSDGAAYRRLLHSLGLKAVIAKRKEGHSYIVDGVLVEVSRVEHLGWFVELELILPEEASREEIGGARDRLMELLRQLSISPSKIEPRSYNQMIHAQLSGIDGTPRSPV